MTTHALTEQAPWWYMFSMRPQRLPWPACSPDLTPIEHLWDILGRKIHHRDPPIQTVAEFEAVLHQKWAFIPWKQFVAWGVGYKWCSTHVDPTLLERCFLFYFVLCWRSKFFSFRISAHRHGFRIPTWQPHMWCNQQLVFSCWLLKHLCSIQLFFSLKLWSTNMSFQIWITLQTIGGA